MGSGQKEIDVAGLRINPLTKPELLAAIAQRIKNNQKTFVVTAYSEFLDASLRSGNIRRLLNGSTYTVADGVGILWADLFLRQPFQAQNFWLRVLEAWWQVIWTGASILVLPRLLYQNIPEKIVGADLIWDLAELAQEEHFKIYLLGGYKETPQKVASELQVKFPRLQVVGASNKHPKDPTVIEDIKTAGPDMLLVSFGKIRQEQWIADHLSGLPVKFAIGLGGSFDYLAGVKLAPPKLVRQIGLEWLYRLITQPSRIFRIYRAVVGLIVNLLRYKVYSSTPFRANGCAVVINKEGKILICQRHSKIERVHPGQKWENYWQFPQGGLDDNEDPILGTQRELFEETGIKSVQVIGMAQYRHRYEWNNAVRPLLTTAKFHHRGQEQDTVFFKFTGDDSEISLDQTELVNYQWVMPAAVERIIAAERREHAKIVLAELAKLNV